MLHPAQRGGGRAGANASRGEQMALARASPVPLVSPPPSRSRRAGASIRAGTFPAARRRLAEAWRLATSLRGDEQLEAAVVRLDLARAGSGRGKSARKRRRLAPRRPSGSANDGLRVAVAAPSPCLPGLSRLGRSCRSAASRGPGSAIAEAGEDLRSGSRGSGRGAGESRYRGSGDGAGHLSWAVGRPTGSATSPSGSRPGFESWVTCRAADRQPAAARATPRRGAAQRRGPRSQRGGRGGRRISPAVRLRPLWAEARALYGPRPSAPGTIPASFLFWRMPRMRFRTLAFAWLGLPALLAAQEPRRRSRR